MGLMSDLKEFGQNFVLAAGAGIAKNIEQRAKEDRAAVLASTKELKARIAKNKAAQTKIDREVEGQLKTLNALAPGLPVEVKKTALQSKELFDIYVDAIKKDTDKSGYWISDLARDKGFDPREIYKGSGTKISQIRSPIAPAKSKKTEQTVSVDSDNILRTLLGAGMGPDEILKQAEENISGSGRGTLSEGDLKYANLVASRRIAPGSAPVTIRGRQKALSESYKKAVGQLAPSMTAALAPKSLSGSKQKISIWANRNRKLVAQSLDAAARYSGTEYLKYVENLRKTGYVDSTGARQQLDNQQLDVLLDKLPKYLAESVQTYTDQKSDWLKEVFSRLGPLPNQDLVKER
jgi:hypothetical protein